MNELSGEYRETFDGKNCKFDIRVHVIELRNIIGKNDGALGSGLSNPYIKMKHLDFEKDTKSQSDCLNTVFDWVFLRQFNGQPYDLFQSSITIAVHHHQLIGSDPLIGQVTVGATDVYMSAGHMLPAQWYPLVDPESDEPAEPQGYIKLQFAINGQNEKASVEELRAPFEYGRTEMLLSPRIQATGLYVLKAKIYLAKDLPSSMGGWGFFMRLRTQAGSVKSENQRGAQVQFNTALQAPILEPNNCDLVEIELVEDGTLGDTIMGRLIFSWKQILADGGLFSVPTWYDLYDRPRPGLIARAVDKVKKAIVSDDSEGAFQEATVFGGRVLMSLDMEENENPSLGVLAMKANDCKVFTDKAQPVCFQLRLFRAQGLVTGAWSSYVQVELCIGSFVVSSQPFNCHDGWVDMYKTITLQGEFPYDSALSAGEWPNDFVESLPKAWIRVYKCSIIGAGFAELSQSKIPGVPTIASGANRMERQLLGFTQCKVSELITDVGADRLRMFELLEHIPGERRQRLPFNRSDEIDMIPEDPQQFEKYMEEDFQKAYIGAQWRQLFKDGSCVLKEEEFAGYLCFAMDVYTPPRPGKQEVSLVVNPFARYLPWTIQQPKTQFFQVRAHIFQAKELPPRHPDGVASAFLACRLGQTSETAVTPIVPMTNNPSFDTTLVLAEVEIPAIGQLAPEFDAGEEDSQLDGAEVDKDADFVHDSGFDLILAPRIEFQMYDQVGNTPVFVGRFFVDTENLRSYFRNPEWFELFVGNPEKDDGYVFASFQLLHREHMFVNLKIDKLVPWKLDEESEEQSDPALQVREAVSMMDCMIRIQVLGLRNVNPVKLPIGSRAIKEPYVEFRIDDPSMVKKTMKSSKPDGANANYMTTIDIPAKMPEDSDFASFLEVLAWEQAPLSLAPSIIAHGAIHLADYYPEKESGQIEIDEAELNRKQRQDQFRDLLRSLEDRGIIKGKGQKEALTNKFKMANDAAFAQEQQYGVGNANIKDPVWEAFNTYMSSPHPAAFVSRVQTFLSGKQATPVTLPSNAELQPSLGMNLPSEGQILHQQGLSADVLQQAQQGPPTNMSVASSQHIDGGDSLSLPELPMQPTGGLVNAGGYDVADTIGPTDAGVASAIEGNNPQSIHQGPMSAASSVGGSQGPASIAGSMHSLMHPVAEGDEGPGDGLADAQGVVGEGDVAISMAMGAQNGGAASSGADRPDDADDQDPDVQEKVETQIDQEFIALRRHERVNGPLEDDTTIITYVPEADGSSWKDLMADSFDEIELFRGPRSNDDEAVGILKCTINVYKKEENGEYANMKDPTDIMSAPKDVNEIFKSEEVEVRVYILKAIQMSPKEADKGAAENYIRLTLGSKSVSFKEDLDESLNPEFYKCYSMRTRLPGVSQLQIAMFDENDISGDELIGATTVDLEDRWFCEAWRNMIYKPVEVRDLYNTDAPDVSQGKLQMIVDVMDAMTAQSTPPEDINIFSRKMRMQMRIIVWDTAKVVPMDRYTSDVFVRIQHLGEAGSVKSSQQTDVHPACKKSELGHFNYRMIFNSEYPVKNENLLFRISLWDEDLTANESIAEGVLPLETLFREAFERNLGKTSAEEMQSVFLKGNEKDVVMHDNKAYPFKWVDVFHPNHGFGPWNLRGKVKLTAEVMPRPLARKMPAGKGRNGPQELPEPIRPPRPANPIFEPDKCKAYIVWTCKEFILNRKTCMICCCCVLLLSVAIPLLFFFRQAFGF